MDLRPIAAPPPVVAAAPLTALEWSARVARDTPPTDVVNTVCGAVDGTGRQKKGFNGHGTAWDALHPALRQIMSLVEQLEPWGTTNCAEIQAVDEMLRAGSVLRNIRLYSRYPATAHLKLPCDNCQGWLERADGCFKIRRA